MVRDEGARYFREAKALKMAKYCIPSSAKYKNGIFLYRGKEYIAVSKSKTHSRDAVLQSYEYPYSVLKYKCKTKRR